MSLEDLTGSSKYIDDLVNTNPVGATDPKSQGDDHIRGIKNVLLNTFPSIDGAITATQAELNILDGVTSSTAELNILDGVTADKDELNYLDLTTGPGTQEASKAVVADANVNTGVSKVTELHVGASGAEVQMTASKVNNAPVVRDASGAAALDVTGDLAGNADTATVVTFRGCRSYLTASQSINSGATDVIDFSTSQSTDSYDTDAIHDPDSNSTRFYVPSGVTKIRVSAGLNFSNGSAGDRSLRIKKNGSEINEMGRVSMSVNGGIAGLVINTSTIEVVGGTDYFEMYAYQLSGGALSLVGLAGQACWFCLEIVE